MSDKPGPCPFCGSERVTVMTTQDVPPWPPNGYVICSGCSARGPRCENREQALARWNAAGQELARLRMIETVAVNLNAMRPHFGTAKYVNAMDELAIAVKHSRSAITTTPKWIEGR